MNGSLPPGAPPGAADPAARLAAARHDLLDLGLRNPLLNYRPLRTRGLVVADERPVEVFRRLVRDGSKFSFRPLLEPEPPAGSPGQRLVAPVSMASPPEPIDAVSEPVEAETPNPGADRLAPLMRLCHDPVAFAHRLFPDPPNARTLLGAPASWRAPLLVAVGAGEPTPAVVPAVIAGSAVVPAVIAAGGADDDAAAAVILPLPDPGKYTDLQLDVALTPQQLQTRLLNTWSAARSFIEEQGVNALFLALGMLHWREAGAPSSSPLRRAPLLLVPVELVRASVRERFQLRYTEADIELNETLVAKLKTEFAVTVPSIPDIDDLDLAIWFAEVALAISGHDDWRVDSDSVVLGFFSYGTFLLYRDLDPTIWPEDRHPAAHPLIAPLLGTATAPMPGSPAPSGTEGKVDAPELPIVLDADASQSEAIALASTVPQLVVQGPPGTGKSQMITNLIAASVAAGRTVLFVAEKMAALDVVKRRLDQTGVGQACLELHSHKTHKKAVLAELQRTLRDGNPPPPVDAAHQADLAAVRGRLDAVVDGLHGPVGASGVSPYRAIGELLAWRAEHRAAGGTTESFAREAARYAALVPPSATTWTEAEFRRRVHLVEELGRCVSALAPLEAHPFWGARRAVALPGDVERLAGLLGATQKAVDTLVQTTTVLAGRLGLAPPAGVHEVERLLRVAEAWYAAPDAADARIDDPAWTLQASEISLLLSVVVQLDTLHRTHATMIRPEAWDAADIGDIRKTIAASHASLWRFVSPAWYRAGARLAALCQDAPPATPILQLALLDDLLAARQQMRRLQPLLPLARRLLGSLWCDAQSDWSRISLVMACAIELHRAVNAGELPSSTAALLQRGRAPSSLGAEMAAVVTALAEHRQQCHVLTAFLEFDPWRRAALRRELAREGPTATASVTASVTASAGETVGPLTILLFADLAAQVALWREHVHRLPELAPVNAVGHALEAADLTGLLVRVAGWTAIGSDTLRGSGAADAGLARGFALGWFRHLLDCAMAERPALATFAGMQYEVLLDRFRELDVRSLQLQRAQIQARHRSRLPQIEGVAVGGQLRILLREFEKKARHLPVRQLLLRAGKAVQAIKPVMMMSPLSVASFLAPGALEFDLVVFDEASQLRPVEAFGALLRARSAVVVGDSRQLPPTSFFEKLGAGADNDDSDEVGTRDVESILGLFAASGAPQRWLRWHYRSRHESLIALANREFYDDRLVVFPSPDAGTTERGLAFRHLPHALYDRGRSRTNPREAAAVAQSVIEHARRHPGLTLGVAAFSVAQQQAVLEQLEMQRAHNPDTEPYFAAHAHEPFFVKNLENVQGDERDVIFISIGYGRTAPGGPVVHDFGPLNRDGGERRLNVLITRARYRCVVHANFTDDDLDLGRSNARGVAALKAFLAYARTGQLAPRGHGALRTSCAGETTRVAGASLPNDGSRADPLVEQVRTAMAARGVTLADPALVQRGAHCGVVRRGFAPDLVLADPDAPQRSILGVFADGPDYRATGPARDRDRLRDRQLADLGWRTVRVWSLDWFRDAEAAGERLLKAVQAAHVANVAATAVAAAADEALVEPQIGADAQTGTATDSDTATTTAVAAPGPARIGTVSVTAPAPALVTANGQTAGPSLDNVRGGQLPPRAANGGANDRSGDTTASQPTVDVTVSTRIDKANPAASAQNGNGRVTVPYVVVVPALSATPTTLPKMPAARLAAAVLAVVDGEGPVHVGDVARRLIAAVGGKRVGTRQQQAIDAVINDLVEAGRVGRRGNFLWRVGMTRAPVRDRRDLPDRRVEWIAPEELAEAIRHVIAVSCGAAPAEVAPAVARLLGFARATEDLRARVDQVVGDLVGAGTLALQAGCVVEAASR